MKKQALYDQIIQHIFSGHFKPGMEKFTFTRAEINRAAETLGLRLPRNLGDLIYTFRFRKALPQAIRECAPEGKHWVIRLTGDARYTFAAVTRTEFVPNDQLRVTKVPDATPGIIAMYALDDEQALLAKLRYNRLIDVFTRVTCHSLQNHLRTKIPNVGQTETDEIYVGVDRRGVHHIIPVQAKGGSDKLGIVQIEQDFFMCAHKFPDLVCRPIGAQFMGEDIIVLFDFELDDEEGVRIARECHYRLVPPNEMTADDLATYKARVEEEF